MRTLLLAAAAALALGAGAVWAQAPGGQPGMPAERSGEPAAAGAMAPSEGQSYLDNEASFTGSIARGYNADELIGQDVVTLEGERVGQIADLLIGPDGRVSHAIVEAGGFLGIGEKNVAVDLETMRPHDDGAFVTEMPQQEFESAPRYEKSGGRWMQAARGSGSPGQQ